MSKLIQHLAREHYHRKGFSPFYAEKMPEWLHEDFFRVKAPLKKKLWAHKRGFMSYKVDYYQLTDENYQDFLPDMEYYRMHPINGAFSHWIDDKLTIRYLLHPFKDYLPEYYFHLYHGEVLRLADCPETCDASIDSLVQLIENKGVLAVKKMIGSHGEGFIKLVHDGHQFLVNDNALSKETLISNLQEWTDSPGSGYLVTEYLKPCQEFARIWPNTANTLRVVVLRNKNKPATIVDAFARFGTTDTGNVEASSLRGITCRVHLNDGYYGDAKVFDNRKVIEMTYHPDTGVLIEGYVPRWDEIKAKIVEISNFLPHLIYMGYDLVITNEGFKIIEINSHQGIGFNQTHTPFLKSPLTKDFFNDQLARIKQEDLNRKSNRLVNKLIRFLKKTKHELSLLLKR